MARRTKINSAEDQDQKGTQDQDQKVTLLRSFTYGGLLPHCDVFKKNMTQAKYALVPEVTIPKELD